MLEAGDELKEIRARVVADKKPLAAKRKGYRVELKAYMVKKELPNNPRAAEHFGVSVDTLKSIMSDTGKKRYSADTLASVLKKAGIKPDVRG